MPNHGINLYLSVYEFDNQDLTKNVAANDGGLTKRAPSGSTFRRVLVPGFLASCPNNI